VLGISGGTCQQAECSDKCPKVVNLVGHVDSAFDSDDEDGGFASGKTMGKMQPFTFFIT
jgi:hypothetical protein